MTEADLKEKYSLAPNLLQVAMEGYKAGLEKVFDENQELKKLKAKVKEQKATIKDLRKFADEFHMF